MQSQTLLFSWLCLFTILQRTFQTFYVVPHLAMGAELSKDYLERTRVMAFNNLFGLYGGMLMHLIAWFLVFGFIFADQGAQLYRPAYTWIALAACAIILVSIFACAFGTRDQIDHLKSNENNASGTLSFGSFYRDIWSVLQNRNYLYLLLGLFFLSLTIGTHETLAIYMGTFFGNSRHIKSAFWYSTTSLVFTLDSFLLHACMIVLINAGPFLCQQSA